MKETIIIIGRDRDKKGLSLEEYMKLVFKCMSGAPHGKNIHRPPSSGVSSGIKKQDVRLGEEREDTPHQDRKK